MSIEIELFRPNFNFEEIEAISEVVKSKWWGLGPKTAEFEKRFAEYIGVKYAVGVNSGTSALQLAVNALQLPKDFVFIVPSISFISTAFAPIYEGYKVFFADIEERDLMMSTRTIESAIEQNGLNREKIVIIPVHLYGDMRDWKSEGFKHVIEDCAHAAGSCIDGYEDDTMAGSMGSMGCFSFHAVKNLACGDGGMVTTNNEEYYKRLRQRRWFGINKSTFDRSKDENLKMNYGWEYDIQEMGYKMHMNDLMACLGIEQLKKLEKGNSERRGIARVYDKELAREEWLNIPYTDTDVTSSRHIYAIRTDKRNELNIFLKEKGIATGVHYKPMYKFGYFEKEKFYEKACPTTEKEWVKLLSLPCYPSLTELEQEYVISKIKEFGRKL